MANLFLNVPSQAANGSGAAVDFTTFGASKTIVVTGDWGAFPPPSITIEINNSLVPGNSTWVPLITFTGADELVTDVACRWIRATVSNYRGGQAPVINIGGTDGGTTFATLVAPAATGVGAAVDISALGQYQTVHVGGTFRGDCIVEMSTDGVNEWGQPYSFQAVGFQSKIFIANWARVRRVGVPVIDPGLPIINIGSCTSVGGGGGAGGVEVSDEGVPLAGGPFGTLNFAGTGVVATDAGGGTALITITGGGPSDVAEQWAVNNVPASQTDVALSAQLSTNFDTIKAVRGGSIVGIATRLSEPITAGQLDVEVTINGVGTGFLITHTAGANPSGGVATQATGLDVYVASDLLGLRYTTNAGFLPITTDLEAYIQVVNSP